MIEDFYPTRPSSIKKLLDDLNLDFYPDILEPCGGKADICDYIRANAGYHRSPQIDVIEINPDLQFILKGKNYRLIHDDFLTFRTHKHYDLIVANFPFSAGDQHLSKALELIEQNGGALRCYVNAETIKNTCTNLRRTVKTKLENMGAEIEFLQNEFREAERATDVEVALIKVSSEKQSPDSLILESLKKSQLVEAMEREATELETRNFIDQITENFNVECRLGIGLIEEYFSLKPYIKNRLVKSGEKDYSSNIIELKIGNAHRNKGAFINEYLEQVRHKYWAVLIEDQRFSGKYTSNILKELGNKQSELKHYDFTLFNIRELEKELSSKITQGIEDSILAIFDEFSNRFAWYDYSANIHYYNGWKTNKAHKINQKVIIPMNGFSAYSDKRRLDDHYIQERLGDMVKVFNYLSDDQINVRALVGEKLEEANRTICFSNIDLRYFEVTFFKKGTCHIKFKNQKLLDKLNIYGSQKKAWLPPSYGRKRYEEFDEEEKAVIDDFQGKDKYEQVMTEPEFYLAQPQTLQLGYGTL